MGRYGVHGLGQLLKDRTRWEQGWERMWLRLQRRRERAGEFVHNGLSEESGVGTVHLGRPPPDSQSYTTHRRGKGAH